MWMSELKTTIEILTQSWLYPALLISVMMLFPMTEYLVFQQEPLSSFAGPTEFCYLIGVIALFLTPFVSPRFENQSWKTKLFSLCLSALAVQTAISIGLEIKYNNLTLLTNQARPLVMAIEKFEEKEGHPPERLEDLVPAYLSAVPRPFNRKLWDFEYMRVNSKWFIQFDVPVSGFDPDYLRYYSKTIQHTPGNYDRKIGDWLYEPG